jgi:hypothetical protein
MLQRTYGSTMGNNAADDMMMHLTVQRESSSCRRGWRWKQTLEYYPSNSILLVVRDSLLTGPSEARHGTFLCLICHMRSLRCCSCCRDCMQQMRYCCNLCNIAAISATLLRSHGTNATSLQQLQHRRDRKKIPYVYNCLSSWKYTGNEKRDWKFAWRVSSWHLNRYYYNFFCLSHKEEMRRRTEFFTVKHVSSRQLWTDLFHFIFLPFSSRRNEKRESFYTAKHVSSRTKYAYGSTQSRENKNRTSKKKRLKQQKWLLSIVPSHSHSTLYLLPDKFYTYVDGGDIGNPRINPPSSGTKPNRILSIRDSHLHVICDHIPHPDKELIHRFANKLSNIELVPRT